MRKTLASAIVLALGIGGALSAPTAFANDAATTTTPPAAADPATEAQAALEVAADVLDGEVAEEATSATVALRDLWLRKAELDGRDLQVANGLLARPSQGSNDPYGDGYTVAEQTPVCGANICVHYVASTADAASLAQAQRTLAVMQAAWAKTKQMGYRSPVSDGTIGGGSHKFDVYLKDVGARGLYGYCAPEYRAKKRTASGFCVLDNNFSPLQFPTGTPDGNLRVTAIHEFFHAVQFAYDYAENPWMMESTATWIEERFAGDVNDNRNYLPYGQLYKPGTPLNKFERLSGTQYGNWIFWEYLSSKFGNGIVRKAWNQAGSLPKDGGKQSLAALTKVLKKKGGFPNLYARFASDNLVPGKTYPEGSAYPAPKPRGNRQLTKKKRTTNFNVRLNHLTSASYRVRPHKALKGKRWKLNVAVSGPPKRATPRARVIVHLKNGRINRKNVKLNAKGKGSTRVTFNAKKVSAVSVTLVNASKNQNKKRYRVTLRAVN